MNPPTRLHRAVRRTLWQAKVHEAVEELAHRIERLERHAPEQSDTSDWLAALADLRHRLNRIADRYDHTLD